MDRRTQANEWETARPAVPRIGRVLDAVGGALFGSGLVVLARAWLGFRSVPGYVAPADAEPWAATRFADGFKRLQWIGTGFAVAGLAVFVAAWWIAGRRRPTGEAPSPPPQ